MGRSPGVGNDNPLQYSCLENSMEKGVWQAISMWSQRFGYNGVIEHIQTYTHTHTNKLESPLNDYL